MRIIVELLILVLLLWGVFHFLGLSKSNAKQQQKKEEQKRLYVLNKINKIYEGTSNLKKDLEYMDGQNLPMYIEVENLLRKASEQIDNVNLYDSDFWLSDKENKTREKLEHDMHYLERQIRQLKATH